MLTSEQIELRHQGVGGSDLGIIAGVSERATATELYHVKRGEMDAGEITRRMYGNTDQWEVLSWLGTEIEPVLARWYERETGTKVRRCNRTLVHRELDWMIAHPDRLPVGGVRRNRRTGVAGSRRVLEFKMRVSTDGWGHSHTDQVPDDVLLQCQQYLEVTGRDLADVVTLFAGREIRLYTVPRDASLAARAIDVGAGFMDMVRAGTPPPVDYEHRTANLLLSVLHPATDGRVIELPPEAAHWHAVREDAKANATQYGLVADAAKAHLLGLMGDAAVGFLPDGSIYNRRETLRQEYTVHESRGVSLTWKKAPRVNR